jgi:hypothetical protein
MRLHARTLSDDPGAGRRSLVAVLSIACAVLAVVDLLWR